jgi:hypothetical protein
MNWRCGSSGRVPALQVQSPNIKPSPTHIYKKKKKKMKEVYSSSFGLWAYFSSDYLVQNLNYLVGKQ